MVRYFKDELTTSQEDLSLMAEKDEPFCLSNKILDIESLDFYTPFIKVIWKKDVKEFVRRLKNLFIDHRTCEDGTVIMSEKDFDFKKKIDKLAGEKLI